MKGYKGFHKGMVCRGKQYAENTVFEEEHAEICSKGMHFCKEPLDVLDYYGFVNGNGELNEFAEVEALDDVQSDDNRKYCTTRLRVGAKLSFAGFIKACIECVIEKTSFDVNKNNSAQIASSGNGAQIGSSGCSARIASSGNIARIGSSGDIAQIASSGNSAQIASSGNGAQIGSSGDIAQIASSGKHCVICCAGSDARVKAKRGSWITLSEWEDDDGGNYVPVCVKTEFVDGERIKEDVYYELIDGEFVEIEEN